MTSFAASLETVRRPDFRHLATVALGFAVIADLLIWIIAGLVLGEGIQIVEPGAETASALGVGPVIAASIIPTVLGLVFVGVLGGMGRGRLAAVVVSVLAVASLALPFTLDVGAGSQIALAMMHLVVGGAVAAVALRA